MSRALTAKKSRSIIQMSCPNPVPNYTFCNLSRHFPNGIFKNFYNFFRKDILKETDTIGESLGVPNWQLVLCLIFSWSCIGAILIKGVKSSGKASYFLAVFPYIILIILLIRSSTLEGATDGMIYFIKPQWNKILEAKVWYAAVTQVFYSLAICWGSIITFGSYNRHDQNIYK
jgi:solute carrier family 6 amino acid transporter-like protein 5/7/9/14